MPDAATSRASVGGVGFYRIGYCMRVFMSKVRHMLFVAFKIA